MGEDLLRMEKQKYLRENIIDKGLPVSTFVEYMAKQKEGGDDIDAWSFEELREVVEKFTKMNKENTGLLAMSNIATIAAQPPENPPPAENTGSTEETQPPLPPALEQVLKPEELKERKQIKIIHDLPEEVKTKELPVVDLTKKQVRIKIVDTEIKEGGVFSSAVVKFVITTEPFNWRVVRKYSDCTWLRNQLRLNYPAAIIPPLDKKGEKMKTASKSLMKRRKWLQQFFDELQRDKTLRSCDLTFNFLSLKEVVQFEKLKKELKKAPPPLKSVFDVKHLEGKAIVKVSNDRMQKSRNISKFIPNVQIAYAKIMKSCEETAQIMRTLSDALARNSNIYKEIAALHASIDCAEMADLFFYVKRIMASLSDLYAKQATNVMESMNVFFKYYKDEMTSFQEISTVVDNMAMEYEKKETRLYSKKNRLFQEGRPQTWDFSPEDIKRYNSQILQKDKELAFPLMLHKETLELEESNRVYGYYLNKYIEETKRVCAKNYRTMRKQFRETASTHATILKDMSDKWIAITEHLNEKVTKLPPEGRIEVLNKVKYELGMPIELNELLSEDNGKGSPTTAVS